MKRLTAVAAAVLVAALASSIPAQGGGNFVSIFDDPKLGSCWMDMHLVRLGPGENDGDDEAAAGRRSGGIKLGEFRGIRPEHVARAQYRACFGKEVPKEETKG